MCRTHDIPGEFLENIWVNQNEVPTFYPNAVTTEPLSHENFNDISESLKKIPQETYAIKDSFNELPADKMGFKILFEADWITYAPIELLQPNTLEGWTIIKDEQELKSWEYAWNNNQSSDKRTFLLNILSIENVFFLAKYDSEQIVAGGIINIAQDVAGLSNVFCNESINTNIWTEISIFIKEKVSTLPIVGYERDKALEEALEAGYKKIGRLKVLLKS